MRVSSRRRTRRARHVQQRAEQRPALPVAAFTAGTEVVVKKSSGGSEKLGRGRKATGRAGKGTSLFKRGTVKEIQLPDPPVPDFSSEEDA